MVWVSLCSLVQSILYSWVDKDTAKWKCPGPGSWWGSGTTLLWWLCVRILFCPLIHCCDVFLCGQVASSHTSSASSSTQGGVNAEELVQKMKLLSTGVWVFISFYIRCRSCLYSQLLRQCMEEGLIREVTNV